MKSISFWVILIDVFIASCYQIDKQTQSAIYFVLLAILIALMDINDKIK